MVERLEHDFKDSCIITQVRQKTTLRSDYRGAIHRQRAKKWHKNSQTRILGERNNKAKKCDLSATRVKRQQSTSTMMFKNDKERRDYIEREAYYKGFTTAIILIFTGLVYLRIMLAYFG